MLGMIFRVNNMNKLLKLNKVLNFPVLCSILIAMTGCITTQDFSKIEENHLLSVQKEIELKQVSHALERGRLSYESGNYSDSVESLLSEAIWLYGTPEDKSDALKYLAFGFCINNLVVSCTQAFERAFIINPSFELSTAERGHPLWDPAFQHANFIYKCLAARRLEKDIEKVVLCQ